MTKNDELGLELLGLVNMKEKMVKDKEENQIKQMQVLWHGFSLQSSVNNRRHIGSSVVCMPGPV